MYNHFVIVCRFEGVWQILRASFWKFSKLSNGGISLNWSITDGSYNP